MARSYSFEHFTAAKPAVSPWKRASAHEKRVFSRDPLPLHYGHIHAGTGMIYQQHREDYMRQEAMRIPQVRPEVQGPQAPASQESLEAIPSVDAFGREGLEEMGRLALESVRRAAREALRGRPLQGARRLADDAVSGALKVVREASDRMSRLASDLSAEQAAKDHSSR